MNENFLVDHICITYDNIAELKHFSCNHICSVPKSFCFGTIPHYHDNMMSSSLVDVPQRTKVASPLLDCSDLARFAYDYAHPSCLSQTDLCFTYICKLSCILSTGNNGHDYLPVCAAWSLLCSTYQSSAAEAWYETYDDLHRLDWFDLASTKFDHRSSVRTLDLILNHKILYICVYHFDHDSMNFTYTSNSDCLLLRFSWFHYDNYMCYARNFRCILSFENNHVHKNDTTCYVYIYSAYTLFFLFLPLSAYQKPRAAFPE